MKINMIMTREVDVVHPNDSLQKTAQKMRDRDVGFLPVYEGDQLLGVVTDRDIAVRALANGVSADAKLGRDYITSPTISCFDDQNVEDAARLMELHQVRRLLILSRLDNRLVGVVSLSDLAAADEQLANRVLQGVCAPVEVL